MLRVDNLVSGYGKLQILSEVSVEARDKEITVVVGPNGSGKSTLLKSIFGLATIHSGRVKLDGEELTGLPAHLIARKGIAYLPQTENIFANLTVHENITMAGYTIQKEELNPRVDEVQEIFPVLKEYMRRKAGTLSGGERQMLAMAMALLRKPKVMMFDEPTGNLSPKIAMQVLSKIVELRDKMGMLIILVEQQARKALELGQKAYLLVGGRAVYEGHPRELLDNPDLSRMYLGLAPDTRKQA